MTKREILHLYNRFGFGLLHSQVEKLNGLSNKEFVNRFIKSSEETSQLVLDLSYLAEFKGKELDGDTKKLLRDKLKNSSLELNHLWVKKMVTTEAALRERMTLFWHGHFACMIRNGLYDLQQNSVLRTHALGNFRTLLIEVSKSAGMINYLNTRQNTKQAPNENFARELMELFTIGRDNYTENDIKEAARAFTGWNHLSDGSFKFKSKKHDFGVKTFFGKTGNWKGEDIIDILLSDRRTADFIASKLYFYFVSDVVNKSHIQEISEQLFSSNYDILSTVRLIMLSDWFYDEEIVGKKIKSPVDLIVCLAKQCYLNIEEKKSIIAIQRQLGQELLAPPNVAGWPGGKRWIDSSSLLFRIKLASMILNDGNIAWNEKGDMAEDMLMMTSGRKTKRSKIKGHKGFKISLNKKALEDAYLDMEIDDIAGYLISTGLSSSAREVLNKSNNTIIGKLSAILSLPEFQMS